MAKGWAGKRLTQLREALQRRFGVLPFEQSQPMLEAWLETALGGELLAEEQACLDQALNDLFGYHLMALSVSRRTRLSENSRVQHCFQLAPQAGGETTRALAEFENLPLASEAIDVALLHHVLEFSERPHQLLREASRVLIPRGHLVILGFNPHSSFGLCKTFARLLGRGPHWRYHSLRLGRMLDWLRLLDFEPVSVRQGFYRPPLQQSGIMRRLQWLERWGERNRSPFGGFYLIVARKEVAAMTPLKPAWQPLSSIASLGVHKPVSRVQDAARNATTEH